MSFQTPRRTLVLSPGARVTVTLRLVRDWAPGTVPSHIPEFSSVGLQLTGGKPNSKDTVTPLLSHSQGLTLVPSSGPPHMYTLRKRKGGLDEGQPSREQAFRTLPSTFFLTSVLQKSPCCALRKDRRETPRNPWLGVTLSTQRPEQGPRHRPREQEVPLGLGWELPCPRSCFQGLRVRIYTSDSWMSVTGPLMRQRSPFAWPSPGPGPKPIFRTSRAEAPTVLLGFLLVEMAVFWF